MDTPKTEASISDLRSMLGGKTPTSQAPASTETPATPAESSTPPAEVKTEPATEPATQETAEQKSVRERGEDGKFVPAGVQKRIDKAIKAQRDAERRTQELEAQLAGKPGSQPAAPSKDAAITAPPAAAAAETAPKQEDFATWDEYSRAVARFEARQEIAAELKKQADIAKDRTAETEKTKQAETFSAAEVEARKSIPDYDEGASAFFDVLPKTEQGRDIADYIITTNQPALMHELGKNPEELKRIAQSPNPAALVREMARFEAKLTAAQTPATPAAKALPKPPANTGGAASAKVVDINDPDIDMQTFKKLAGKALSRG